MEGISKKTLQKIYDGFDSGMPVNNLTDLQFNVSCKEFIKLLIETQCKELDPWLPIQDAPKDRKIILDYPGDPASPLIGIYCPVDNVFKPCGMDKLLTGLILHRSIPTRYKEIK